MNNVMQPNQRNLVIRETFQRPDWRSVVISLLALLLTWAVVEFLEEATPRVLDKRNTKNIALIFLLTNVFIAGYFGFVCGLITSVLSALLANYFYISPINSFRIEELPEQINLALFIATALVTAIFTANLRARAQQIAKREKRTQVLYDLNRRVTAKNSFAEAIACIQEETSAAMGHDVTILLPSLVSKNVPQQSLTAHRQPFSNDNMALAIDVWESSRTRQNGHHTAVPMRTPDTDIGILFICYPAEQSDEGWMSMLQLLADQAALLIERLNLSSAMQESLVTAEREKLRSMLLSSVSHDLKTPLASIIGSLSVYHSMGHRLDDERKRTLTETALDEAQRLDSFISNILDITRLESGAITFKEEWLNLESMVTGVVKRLKDRLRNHPVTIHPASPPVELKADPTMTGQILQNLLDNAAKYTPHGTDIDVQFTVHSDAASIVIRDHGPGIPAEKLDTVFDKYARLKLEDSQVAGTGLGLAIAKTVMEAQGGTITAANHPEGGAVFTLTFNTFRAVEEAA